MWDLAGAIARPDREHQRLVHRTPVPEGRGR
jgi:hypothetical protein